MHIRRPAGGSSYTDGVVDQPRLVAQRVLVTGASGFPQNAGYNPTGTLAALAYWAADAIRTQYLKNPGPLVHA